MRAMAFRIAKAHCRDDPLLPPRCRASLPDRLHLGARPDIADHIDALGRLEIEGRRRQRGVALPVLEHDFGALTNDVDHHHARQLVVAKAQVDVREFGILGLGRQAQPLQPVRDAKGAIEAYERKLALDPQAKAVRETVERLRKKGR